MTQNNLYMENDEMRLYVDVQPLFIDELENSKNAAAASAAAAALSETAASNWKNDIEDYKTNIELFYAQASDDLTNLYNSSVSDLNGVKSSAIENLQAQNTAILNNIDSAKQSALNNISTNGTSYVNQARSYAEQAQNTVDNRVSLEHLNQSKALETGNVSTDADVLTDIKKYAHSTYVGDQAEGSTPGYLPDGVTPLDPKKFTKIGSPNITDDGIASGFSSNNYLKVPSLTLDGSRSDIVFVGKFTTPSTMDTEYSLLSATSLWTNLYIRINSNKTLNSYCGNSYTNLTTILTPSTTYSYRYSITNSGVNNKLELFNSNGVLIDSEDITNSGTLSCTGALNIGTRSYAEMPFTGGSIDLKYFSITVDGVEVFSGNKTGVDTVKADDWTPTGDPTISEDGILTATLTSQDDYILTPSITGSNIEKIKLRFKGVNKPVSNVNITSGIILTTVSTNGEISFLIQTTGGNKNLSTSVPNILWGQWVDLIWEKTANGYRAGYKLATATDYTYGNEYATEESLATAQISLLRFSDCATSIGQMDLNCCKIYDTAGLFYQACLKIPYTESKTGSKIVDSIYRDRVNYMAEQFGYAPYYTLSDTDFTLPMGEIYGMIENLRKLIIQRTSQE